MTRKKKSLKVTFSNDDSSSKSDFEELGRALISIAPVPKIMAKDMTRKQENQESSTSNNDDANDVLKKWEDDKLALVRLNARVQVLVEENHKYLLSIATLKAEL